MILRKTNNKWFSYLAVEVSGKNTFNECYESVSNEKYDEFRRRK